MELDEPIGNVEHVILTSKDFKYPNRAEFIKYHEKCPKLEIFGFKHNHPIKLLVNDRLSMDEAARISNLYWWDNCLINRFSKVCHTYVFLISSFHRGFSDDWRENTHKQAVNHILFEYYAEIFYYFFFSSRDIIAHILCSYFSIPFPEDKISFNQKFIDAINNQSVKDILLKFDTDTSEAEEFRNTFTHRFTPNIPDYRSIISKDKRALEFRGGSYLQSEIITTNIELSLTSLSELMKKLKAFVN